MFRKPVFDLEWGQAVEDHYAYQQRKKLGNASQEIVTAGTKATQYLEIFRKENPPLTYAEVFRYVGSCLILMAVGYCLLLILNTFAQSILTLAHP